MPYAGRFARIERTGEPDAEGWVEVSLRFDVEEMACEYALGFGTGLEVLEPASLREKVLAAAQNVVAFYNSKASH
jgi:predicted DNA-binding transcriptional regulator YafY